ncbi:hypothetical protein [Arcticibacter sp. MXS-1]|uniref:hypothetical protein n=1 Tax=Arcticibacter sp. MXS-1 TaxID=3341726 RepID=UPI0035A97393
MSKFEEQKTLVPPFGHTLGHCGIAVISDGMCLLYAGEAYYFVQNFRMLTIRSASLPGYVLMMKC